MLANLIHASLTGEKAASERAQKTLDQITDTDTSMRARLAQLETNARVAVARKKSER